MLSPAILASKTNQLRNGGKEIELKLININENTPLTIYIFSALDGNLLETGVKSVKYSVLYMKAIKALQEAQARIETLEAKVATLEGS